jgi:ABC-type Fe3+/spermidine/putrescine transport system ATPase subunit
MSLRRQMQGELKSIQQQTGVTFVSVTHDQEEALAMSDQVVVMNAGRVEQVASPAGVFDQPATRFVAEFMGSQVFEVPVLARSAAGAQVRFGGGDLTVPGPVEGETVTVAIRPERVRLVADGGWSAVVRDRVFKGAVMSLGLELADGSDLRCDVPHDAVPAMPKVGEALSVAIRPEDVWVIPGGPRVRAEV